MKYLVNLKLESERDWKELMEDICKSTSKEEISIQDYMQLRITWALLTELSAWINYQLKKGHNNLDSLNEKLYELERHMEYVSGRFALDYNEEVLIQL